MKLFRELILSASGKAAIVLGGGPSCPSDFSRVREAFPDAVKISANLHGFKLTDCDYIVSVDDELKQKRDAAGITAPFISYHRWAEYRLVEFPHFSESGIYAAWIAWNLGACPILLCGMGCYSEGATYFHDADAFSPGNRIPVDSHVRAWMKLHKTLPAPVPVRAVSGPLVNVFGAYDPKESFADYPVPERLSLLNRHEGVLIRVTRSCRILGERFEPGQVVEVCKSDAQTLLRQKRAVKVRPQTLN